MHHGITEKNKLRSETDERPGKANEGGNKDRHAKANQADRYGDKGKARPYRTDRAGCKFKDSRKWRTETQEQAQ